MSDYSRQEDFSVKDALTTGDPDKVIKGSEVDSEFDALVTAVATKIDALTGHTTNDIVYLNSVGKIVDAGILYTDVARLTTTQTISGDKTFTGATIVPTPTAATHAVTKDYSDARSIKAGTVLTQNPYTIDTTATQAHGLGAAPTFVKVYLECLTTEFGFSVGDRVDSSGATVSGNFSVSFDATNCYLATGSGALRYVQKTGTTLVTLTPANWKLIITPMLLGG